VVPDYPKVDMLGMRYKFVNFGAENVQSERERERESEREREREREKEGDHETLEADVLSQVGDARTVKLVQLSI